MNNDTVVLALQKKVELKRDELKKSQKFTPVTNCSIEFEEKRYNIHALTKYKAIHLLIKLNAYRLSAQDIGMIEEFCISGFNIVDWISDLKSKLAHINKKEEQKKLVSMEKKLNLLLSDEKKVEFELDSLAKDLEEM
jgi:hypothetical protein